MEIALTSEGVEIRKHDGSYSLFHWNTLLLTFYVSKNSKTYITPLHYFFIKLSNWLDPYKDHSDRPLPSRQVLVDTFAEAPFRTYGVIDAIIRHEFDNNNGTFCVVHSCFALTTMLSKDESFTCLPSSMSGGDFVTISAPDEKSLDLLMQALIEAGVEVITYSKNFMEHYDR